MSENVEKNVEFEKASEVLFEQHFVPAFLKAAELLNIAPQTREDLDEMLKIAELVRTHRLNTAPQQSQTALLKTASSDLERLVYGDKAAALQVSPDVVSALKTLVQ